MKIGRVEKLAPNLKDKKGSVVHIKALDQALKHGLKLKKVHRVIEFQQSRWMKAYIMLNTRLRKDAKNEFEKDFFKLMNSSVFGKTMENIKNHKDMKLLTSDKKYLKHVMKLNFNPIQDGVGEKSPPPYQFFSPVTSTNVGINPQKFLTFSFNPFDRLV